MVSELGNKILTISLFATENKVIYHRQGKISNNAGKAVKRCHK